MPQNALLTEFLNKNDGELSQCLTDAFDEKLHATESEAIENLRTTLEQVLAARIAKTTEGENDATR